jgi:hypothetical protein
MQWEAEISVRSLISSLAAKVWPGARHQETAHRATLRHLPKALAGGSDSRKSAVDAEPYWATCIVVAFYLHCTFITRQMNCTGNASGLHYGCMADSRLPGWN